MNTFTRCAALAWLGLAGVAEAGEGKLPPMTIELTPIRMPPTRTICEVRTDTLTATVEWNPSDLSPLRQEVLLPEFDVDTTPEEILYDLKVQCWSEEARPDIGQGIHWQFGGTFTPDLRGALAWRSLGEVRDAVLDIAEAIEANKASSHTDAKAEEKDKKLFGRLQKSVRQAITGVSTTSSSERETPLLTSSSHLPTAGEKAHFSRQLTTTAALPQNYAVASNREASRALQAALVDSDTLLNNINTCLKDKTPSILHDKSLTTECPLLNTDSFATLATHLRSQQRGLAAHTPFAAAKEVEYHEQTDRSGRTSRDRNVGSTFNAVEIRARYEQDSLTDRLHVLDTRLAGQSSTRSVFGPVPDVVSKTLTVLGDIALKRAEERTREMIVDKLMGQVCDDGVDLYSRWVSLGARQFPVWLEVSTPERTIKKAGNRMSERARRLGLPGTNGIDYTGDYGAEMGTALANLAHANLSSRASIPLALAPVVWASNNAKSTSTTAEVAPTLMDDVFGGGNSTRPLFLRIRADVSAESGPHWKVDCHGGPVPTGSTLNVFTHTVEGTSMVLTPQCTPYTNPVLSPDEAHLILRPPVGDDPEDRDAVIFTLYGGRDGKKPSVTLRGGRADPSFGIRLENTCEVIKDRPFADIARSGPEISRALQADLVDTLTLNLGRVRSQSQEFDRILHHTVKPLLKLVLPPVLDAARQGRALTAREAQAVVAAIRQHMKQVAEEVFDELQKVPSPPTDEVQKILDRCPAAHSVIQVALGALADCIDQGTCDLRQVAAKVADPKKYYDLENATCSLTSRHLSDFEVPEMSPAQQQQVVRIVDALYTVFAPNPDLTEKHRATAAVKAAFQIVTLSVELGKRSTEADEADLREALMDALGDLERLVLAGIEDDLAGVAKEATSLVSNTIRLATHDTQCTPTPAAGAGDDRVTCANEMGKISRSMDRVLPWITTLIAHAEQIKDERNGDLTEEELEKNVEARTKALEELIDSSTRRKQRGGDWVVSIGAGVGLRLSGNLPQGWRPGADRPNTIPLQPVSTVAGDRTGIVQTPLTLPIGFAVQYLADNRFHGPRKAYGGKLIEQLRQSGSVEDQRIGLGFHAQLSAVDVGQYVIAGEEIRGVTWNEFLMAGAQLGLIVGTPRDTFVIATDYRYAPAVGTRGAHQIGLALTYYVPFFDFN